MCSHFNIAPRQPRIFNINVYRDKERRQADQYKRLNELYRTSGESEGERVMGGSILFHLEISTLLILYYTFVFLMLIMYVKKSQK